MNKFIIQFELYFEYLWGNSFQKLFITNVVIFDKELSLLPLARLDNQDIDDSQRICKNIQSSVKITA